MKPSSCASSKTWPISPSRATGSRAASKTGPTKAWKSAAARYLIPGSNQPLRTGDSLGRDYERANLPLVTDRVARSGVRLAALLNEVFK